jgi:hypothetical protein
MPENKRNININNNGSNPGLMVGQHYGPLILQLPNNVKIPSHLALIVKTLSSVCFIPETSNIQDLSIYKTEDKLLYNCVIQYREIINEYAKYYPHCDKAMNLYDDSNIGSKNRILFWVKICYLEYKGALMRSNDNVPEIDIVRTNSDLLISKVAQRIKDTILQSVDCVNINYEDLELGIYCFVCYCFMECKILEKPI